MRYSYKIEQAIRASAALHKNQVRKGVIPYPYVTHPFTVAMVVSDYTDDEDTISAALLHDTIEDTDYTLAELQEDFGGEVKDIVESLSEPQSYGMKIVTWKMAKKQYLKQLQTASEKALIVCAADKIHNMRCMIEDYNDDYRGFIKNFAGNLENRLDVYHDIHELLNKKLKSKILSEFNHVYGEYKTFIETVDKEESKYGEV